MARRRVLVISTVVVAVGAWYGLECSARDFAAGVHTAGGQRTGVGPVDIGQERTTRVGSDCRNGSDSWTETETMQSQGGF